MPASVTVFPGCGETQWGIAICDPNSEGLFQNSEFAPDFEVQPSVRRWHRVCSTSNLMDSSLSDLKALQGQCHPFCLVCSGSNPYGLALAFEAGAKGELKATFHPNAALEGYQGLLHGGVTASLLDGIMTNCLFAHGVAALTAELRVRYREPVALGPKILLRAWIEESHPPLYLLSSELIQEGCLRATASAKFMKRHAG
jgi:acyl-coenzyme A thioesterase PaaI-like protein